MQRLSTIKLFLSFLFLAIIVPWSACSNERGVAGRGQGAGTDTTSSRGTVEGGIEVSLTPESPKVTEALRVQHAGGANAEYRWERNGEVIDGQRSAVLGVGNFIKGDTITVQVTAAGKTGNAQVRIANSPPVVAKIRYSPESIHHGVDMTVSPEAEDADGDEVQFRFVWSVNGEELMHQDVPLLKGDKFKRGDTVQLIVTPYDNNEDGAATRSKPIVIPNAPPRFVSAPQLAFQGAQYRYAAIAQDPDGDVLAYSLAAAPPGMVIDGSSGVVTWAITREAVGTHAIEIIARDPEGLRAVQKYTLVITLSE